MDSDKLSKVQAIRTQFINKRLAFGKRKLSDSKWEYYAYLKPAYSPASAIAKLNIHHNDKVAPNGTLLCNFIVRPKFRSFGVARKLMQYVIADNDLPREITLFAWPLNDSKTTDNIKQIQLEKFYHSLGFRHTGHSFFAGLGTQMVLNREAAKD